MNWKIILLLSLFGVVMGIASLFGISQGVEWILWIIIAFASAFILSVNVTNKFFAHALFIGLLDGIYPSVIQLAFFDTYILNNPQLLEGFQQLPATVEPRLFVLVIGPFIGIVYGLFIGLITRIIEKFRKK
jgi:hypothetical protein